MINSILFLQLALLF